MSVEAVGLSALGVDGVVVRAQRWDSVVPPSTEPQLTVGVVVPARDCQQDLDRTLAALAVQSYPEHLMEVVVVDDSSDPPLRLPSLRPAGTRLIRRDGHEAHGSGPARHVGAINTDAAILLFLDADMVASRDHVTAHAKWHHIVDHALVLGMKRFVSFDEIAPRDVAAAVQDDGLADLLRNRPAVGHRWQEFLIRRQQDLTRDDDDAFLAVVGADLSIRRDLYLACGGFAQFGLRGIVDTEFGYRAFTRGAVLIPEKSTLAYHQGPRTFSRDGDSIKLERTGLVANHIPAEVFRPANRNRIWKIPTIAVFVKSNRMPPQTLQAGIDSVLGSEITDLHVTVVEDPSQPVPGWLRDYFSSDARVDFRSSLPPHGFPSPYTATIAGGVSVQPQTLGRMLQRLREAGVGRIRTQHHGGAPSLMLSRTRALARTLDYQTKYASTTIAETFGEIVVATESAGVQPASFRVTPQGMIAPEGI